MIQMQFDPGSSVSVQGGVTVTFYIPLTISIHIGPPQIQQHVDDPAKQYHLIEGPVPVAQPVNMNKYDQNGFYEKK
jgi:hypothetical protein